MILKQHAESISVIGYNRICIYDLPRRDHDFIPKEIGNKFNSLINFEEVEINLKLNENEKQWLEFLIEKEYLFFIPINFIDCFPEIDLTWQSPSRITNAIIDAKNLDKTLNLQYFEDVNCLHIVVRFTNISDFNELSNFLKNEFNDLTFQYVELIINHSLSNLEFINFKKKTLKEIPVISKVESFKKLISKKRFKPQFIVSIETFTEAQKNNLYFNRKLFIDESGNFKNGIEINKSFANFSEIKNIDDFEKIIKKSKLKNLWNINKNQIDVCKDCEFRFMCVDNRIPIERSKNEFYNEIECNYNPYISKWFGEENYKNLKDIGIISDKIGFLIDHERILKINNEIWIDA